MDRNFLLGGLSLALAWDWTQTLTLIFGGCCSNALTLEQLTLTNPHAGSLITFAQFLFITLHGLPKFVKFTPYPRLKPRQISILPYLAQVVLFYLVSLLNNAAFAYKIPMPVHIVFRSGGLIINMVMGWLLQGRRYPARQIISVLVITSGVALTTLSAVTPRSGQMKASSTASPTDIRLYLTGISILFVALVFSSILGIVQDLTYTAHRKRVAEQPQQAQINQGEPWQESMFYLHFLSMPMFLLMRQDLASQFESLWLSPSIHLSLPPTLSSIPKISTLSTPNSLNLPSGMFILLLNTITQLVCVAGVHRLTSRVSSLTVTLVLVVRKAVSLLISVFLFSDRYDQMDLRAKAMMLGGAGMVFVGTLAYSVVAKKGSAEKAKKD
ncbi:UAA transporter [Cristinia sonorae]|uniref:UAA transporter n=1 Tax=Cristinia sonorae TaxID=1940300 RepID=A0A8K0XN15_9AGAR|nr:UAA transporter [Cristinia sonorae]